MTGQLIAEAAVADRGVEVELRVQPGEVVAVLGPNGAGKSTMLSLIAGLLRPDRGSIRLDGRVLVDTGRGQWTAPYRRQVALLAQEALLFPHLSARDNVAFPARSRGTGRQHSRTDALGWLRSVDAEELAESRPAQLSGGQAQRVAVARALAADPALLLLDEPLAALDVNAAPALRQLLRRVLRGNARSALLVTHDVLDAVVLADRAIVLDGGRIVEDGPIQNVLTAPRSAFAARIAGINLLTGIATDHGVRTSDGLEVTGRPEVGHVPGRPAVAVFSPGAVAVHAAPPSGSPRNVLAVQIRDLEPRGDVVRVHAVGGLAADITLPAVAELDLRPGVPAYFAVKATEVALHPSDRNGISAR